jgi:hypothetical protein
MRKLSAVFALLLLATAVTQAGQTPLAGNWKISFLDQGNLLTFWILKLESKDGKLQGTVVTSDKVNLPPTTLSEVSAKDGQLKFELKLQATVINFTCKFPKGEAKKLHGIMSFLDQSLPVQMEATKLDTLKDVEAIVPQGPKGTFKELKDAVAEKKDDIGVFAIAEALIAAAAADKVPAAQVKEMLAPVILAAADYSDVFQQNFQFDLAGRLAKQEAYAALGEELGRKLLKDAGPNIGADLLFRVHDVVVTSLDKQGKKVEAGKFGEELARKLLKDMGPEAKASSLIRIYNMLARSLEKQGNKVEAGKVGEELARKLLKDAGPNPSIDVQIRFYEMLAASLEKQGNQAEAAKARETFNTMELKAHEDNEKEGLGFTPGKFEGRKGNKVVLVELFTGAQCPPCVAADLGFEALSKTYTTKEVVLLQYHLHIPGPDPMTNHDTQLRAKYYGDEVHGTPSIFFNGKPSAGGGGPKSFAENKYKEYREVIDPLLEGETTIKLSAAATRSGDDIAVTATASGYKAGGAIKLRFVLIEPWVRYLGGNGLSFHAHVVRAMPGGPEGFALDKNDAKESASINLTDLRERSGQDLDQFANLAAKRPFSFRNLQLVAFIQDDESKEILAAVEVPVK